MENVDVNASISKEFTSIKALGEYVLVKQSMIRKKGKIITDASKNDNDKFDISFRVLQLGSKCTSDVQVGDIPIFDEYVKFNLGRILQKDKDVMVSLLLVHENSIIGVDKDPYFKMVTS